ncbi:MAG: MotA/TolQ/ExbB proton channel family protein [Gammaproteobacteria bacterium]|nr:MotA/TolQ/ExbB proton channel family protein [Gammaproteobacteria bacterium]
MLALNQFFETINGFIELGGNVLWAIMAVLFFMWLLILERYWFMYRSLPAHRNAMLQDWDARRDTGSWYAKRIRDEMISITSAATHRNLSMIKTLIAICPLLGLLGTVTGMVGVFEVMAVAGTGNARAMAAGVSKATVPTMAGMVAALSGVYFSTHLEHKADAETERLEDMLQYHD